MCTNIIFLFAVVVEIKGFDYCSVEDCVVGTHTLCKYRDPKNVVCQGAQKVGLNQTQKKAILDQHNEVRQALANGKVPSQPGAANMMKMKWNHELELIAQRWANHLPCSKIDHDECRSTKDGTPCGQNAGMTHLQMKHPDYIAPLLESLNLWYSEVKFVEHSDVDKFTRNDTPSGTIAHYTQLVWWNSSEIGCGSVIAPGDQFYAGVVLICNYKPEGNIEDDPIYEQGEACSKCLAGTHCSTRFPGLCTGEADEMDDLPSIGAEFAFKPSLLIVTGVLLITISFSY